MYSVSVSPLSPQYCFMVVRGGEGIIRVIFFPAIRDATIHICRSKSDCTPGEYSACTYAIAQLNEQKLPAVSQQFSAGLKLTGINFGQSLKINEQYQHRKLVVVGQLAIVVNLCGSGE